MAHIEYEALTVTITTGTVGGLAGSGTGNSAKTYNGLLHAIQYVVGGSSWAEDTVLAITAEKTAMSLLSLTCTGAQTWFPRRTLVNAAGASLSSAISEPFPLADERIVVTVTSGSSGGTRTGTFRFWVS